MKGQPAINLIVLTLILLTLLDVNAVNPSIKKPELLNVTAVGGPEIEPTFEVRFLPGTFQVANGEIIGVYDGGALKYKLLAENNSSIVSGIARVKIPRLKVNPGVGIFLRNSQGTSVTKNIMLQPGATERGRAKFECVNCSHVFGNGVYSDSYTVKHTNSGITQASGADSITISPPFTSNTPCNSRDFVYTGSRATWLDPQTELPITGHGTVVITASPPINNLLRAPNNKVTVSWTLPGLHVDRFYQVLFEGVEIIGVCQERVVP